MADEQVSGSRGLQPWERAASAAPGRSAADRPVRRRSDANFAKTSTAVARVAQAAIRSFGTRASRRCPRFLRPTEGQARRRKLDNFVPVWNEATPLPQRSGWLFTRNPAHTHDARMHDDPSRRAGALNRDLNAFPGMAGHVDWLARPTADTGRVLGAIAQAHAIADFYCDVMNWHQVGGFDAKAWAEHVRQLAPDVVRVHRWVNGRGAAAASTTVGAAGNALWVGNVRVGADAANAGSDEAVAEQTALAVGLGTAAGGAPLAWIGAKLGAGKLTYALGAVPTAAEIPQYMAAYRAAYDELLRTLATVGHPERGQPETHPLQAVLTRPEFADRMMSKLSESAASAVFCSDPVAYGTGRFMPGLPVIESVLAGALLKAQASLLALRSGGAPDHAVPGRTQLILRHWVYFAARHRAAYPNERAVEGNPAPLASVRAEIVACLGGPDGARPSEEVQRAAVAMLSDPRVGRPERELLEAACVAWTRSLARELGGAPASGPSPVRDASVATSIGVAWVALQHARRTAGTRTERATAEEIETLVRHLVPRVGRAEARAALTSAFSPVGENAARQPSEPELQAVERAVAGPHMPHSLRIPKTPIPDRPVYEIGLARGRTHQGAPTLGMKVHYAPGVIRLKGKGERRLVFGIGRQPPVTGIAGQVHAAGRDDLAPEGNAIVAATALATADQFGQLVRPDRMTMERLLDERARLVRTTEDFGSIADASRAMTLANLVRMEMGTETSPVDRPPAPMESIGASLLGAWHLLPKDAAPRPPARPRVADTSKRPADTVFSWKNPNRAPRALSAWPIGAQRNTWRPTGMKVCVHAAAGTGVVTPQDRYAALARDAARRDMLADPVGAFDEHRLREEAELGTTYGYVTGGAAGLAVAAANAALWDGTAYASALDAPTAAAGQTVPAATMAAWAASTTAVPAVGGVALKALGGIYGAVDSMRAAYVKSYLAEKQLIFDALQRRLNGPMEPRLTIAGRGDFNGRDERALRRDLIERATTQGPTDSSTWLEDAVWQSARSEAVGAQEMDRKELDTLTWWGHMGHLFVRTETVTWAGWKRRLPGWVPRSLGWTVDPPTRPLPDAPQRPDAP